jgi:uncharacterized protein
MVIAADTDPLDVIDRYLMSDRSPENSMGLSDLDGFLTAITIGPQLIMPSEWLPIIWGGENPKFKNSKEAELVMSALMARYNEIIRGFQQTPPDFDPVFWETNKGIVIAADWAEGFNDAVIMRRSAWKPLFDDIDGSKLFKPLAILCFINEGRTLHQPAVPIALPTPKINPAPKPKRKSKPKRKK